MTTVHPAPTAVNPDPRDPEDRLARFFDPGTMALLIAPGHLRRAGRPRSGAGLPRDRVLHRRHDHGRGDGGGRLPAHRRRHRRRAARARAGDRHLALRRRPAGRGRHRPARRRRGVRRDDPGLGPDPADLGGARARSRWGGLRSRADRPGGHGSAGPRLRHRPRRGPLGHRRAGRHGGPRRTGHPRAALGGGAHRHRHRAERPGHRPAGGGPAGRAGHLRRRSTARPTSTWRRCCPRPGSAPTTSSR